MAARAPKCYTPEEYLALEEQSQIRHKYLNGEIFDMAGGTTQHNLIALNAVVALRSASGKRPCSVFANDVLLRIMKGNICTYPDVMVICGKIEYEGKRRDVVTNPVVIIEVLSDSTEKYDRTDRFAFYPQIPTLQEYVMIDQSRVYVECFRKTKSKLWTLETYRESESILKLPSLEIEVCIAALYERVEWEAA